MLVGISTGWPVSIGAVGTLEVVVKVWVSKDPMVDHWRTSLTRRSLTPRRHVVGEYVM